MRKNHTKRLLAFVLTAALSVGSVYSLAAASEISETIVLEEEGTEDIFETESVSSETPEPAQTDAPATEPEQAQTDAPALEPEPAQTEAPALEPETVQTEAPAAEQEPAKALEPTTEPEPVQTETPALEPETVQTQASETVLVTEPEPPQTMEAVTEPETESEAVQAEEPVSAQNVEPAAEAATDSVAVQTEEPEPTQAGEQTAEPAAELESAGTEELTAEPAAEPEQPRGEVISFEDWPDEELETAVSLIGAMQLGTPTGVQLKSSGSGQITVSWKAVTGADGYEVYRIESRECKLKLVATVGKVTSYTDKTAKNGSLYEYYIRAYAGKGSQKKTSQQSVPVYGRTAYQTPVLYDVSITGVSSAGFTISGKISSTGKITKVSIPAWSEKNGQDDLVWHTAVLNGKSFSATIRTAEHRNETGKYVIHVYTYDETGEPALYVSECTVPDGLPLLSSPMLIRLGSDGYTVSCLYEAPQGLQSVRAETWTTAGGQNDLTSDSVKLDTAGRIITVSVKTSEHANEKGEYKTNIYLYDKKNNCDVMTFTQTVPAKTASKELYLDFGNVGSGDAVLISSKGSYMLVDTGRLDQEIGNTIRRLKQRGVTSLSVIITHTHWDHLDGLTQICKNFKIDRVYVNDAPTGDFYNEEIKKEITMKAVRALGVKVEPVPAVGTKLKCGDATIEVIGPLDTYDYRNDGMINNMCVWLRVSNGEKTYICGGDAQHEAESSMAAKVNVKADIFKVSHHGEDTSTRQDIVDKVKPQYAVITRGALNNPLNPEIVNRLTGSGAKVLRTDLLGDISFSVLNGSIQYLYKNKRNNAAGAPTIISASCSELSAEGYKVTVRFSSPSGVREVLMPTWTQNKGQDDLVWHKASVSGSTAVFTVKTSAHKNETGSYVTHIYVYDTKGKQALKGLNVNVPAKTAAQPSQPADKGTVINTGRFEIISAQATAVSSAGYTVKVTFSAPAGVSRVMLPTWTQNKGQDDIVWHAAEVSGSTATFTVKTADHKKETGRYITHVYVYDRAGKHVLKGLEVSVPAASSSQPAKPQTSGGSSAQSDKGQTAGSGSSQTTGSGSSSATVYGGVDYSAVFDAAYYLNRYPDLKKAFGNNAQAALKHFVSYGMNEGRQASPAFNVAVYRARYADLQRAFGGALKSYYLHYIRYGKREGRSGK